MSRQRPWIPFNRPHLTGNELRHIEAAIDNLHLSGNGPFTRRCQQWLEAELGARRVLLTHSCTAALEMAAILAGIEPGDEVIMPSFTFVSTANAVVLRRAVPVFVDIRPDTLNIDEGAIEAAITARTRAISVVHYAGVGAEMDPIMAIAARHGLLVLEDAAQAIFSAYKGRPLGGIAPLAAVSFHETKNVISGEGGALVINDDALVERAEIIWEKGTNRVRFHRGEIDKYTWVDVGSSYVCSEIIAAFLWAQLQAGRDVTTARLARWDRYHAAFDGLEADGALRRPIVGRDVVHNAHLYYLLLPSAPARDEMLSQLAQSGIGAPFHYVPLHSSPAGRKFGRISGDLAHTDDLSARLIRLPLHAGLSDAEQDQVIRAVHEVCTHAASRRILGA